MANPASYLVQKVLTKREGAGRAKVGKDLLYIHDTLQMFGPRLHERRPLGARVLALLHANHVKNFSDRILVTSAAPLAAEIAMSTGRPSPPSATVIATTCRVGLQKIFGV